MVLNGGTASLHKTAACLAPDGTDPTFSFPADVESEFVWHEIDGAVNIARAAIYIGNGTAKVSTFQSDVLSAAFY